MDTHCKEKVRNILNTLNLFQGVPENILFHFAEKAQFRKQPKGKVVFVHSSEAHWFFVVFRGWVKLFRETLEGSEAIIDVLTDKDIFGEDSLFNDSNYTYSAEIVEDTQYIALPTSLLSYYIEKEPKISINFLKSISRTQRLRSRTIEHLNVQNAPQRIGCFLLRLCSVDTHNEIILNLPYDKTLIAGQLGMKPETFSRALSKLKNDTGIRVNGSTVAIPSLDKLTEYTCRQCSQSFHCNDCEKRI